MRAATWLTGWVPPVVDWNQVRGRIQIDSQILRIRFREICFGFGIWPSCLEHSSAISIAWHENKCARVKSRWPSHNRIATKPLVRSDSFEDSLPSLNLEYTNRSKNKSKENYMLYLTILMLLLTKFNSMLWLKGSIIDLRVELPLLWVLLCYTLWRVCPTNQDLCVDSRMGRC